MTNSEVRILKQRVKDTLGDTTVAWIPGGKYVLYLVLLPETDSEEYDRLPADYQKLVLKLDSLAELHASAGLKTDEHETLYWLDISFLQRDNRVGRCTFEDEAGNGITVDVANFFLDVSGVGVLKTHLKQLISTGSIGSGSGSGSGSGYGARGMSTKFDDLGF